MISLKSLAFLAFATVPAAAGIVDVSQFTQSLVDSGIALQVLAVKALATSLALAATNPQGGCTLDKIKYRREW